MRRFAYGLMILAMAVGCRSGGGTTTTPGGGLIDESGGFEEPGFGRSGLERSTAPGGAGDLRMIYFDFDDATLRPDAKEGLQHNAQMLRDSPDLMVEIQGHCDERGTEEYNLALGQRRAESAKRYLIDLGIRPSRLHTKSFGESSPAVMGHSESAWAKNRRDEFVRIR